MTGFRTIGIIGLINLSLLTCISIWRTSVFIYYNRENLFSINVRKRLLLHILLISASAFSIPMYVSFVMINYYGMATYAFHKLEPFFLIAAYSITIHDWSSVLYDIHEMSRVPLLMRKASLIIINGLFGVLAVTNFFVCLFSSSLNSFTGSPIYVAMIFMQLVAELLLTTMMLQAGIRLSKRIHGVWGFVNNNNNTRSLSSTLVSHQARIHGFDSALNRLIVVMAVCAVCILFQSILLLLNYILGYQRDPHQSVGPMIFYWTFYAWLPLWGPILSLLHLSRTRNLSNKIDIRLPDGTMDKAANYSFDSTDGGGTVRIRVAPRIDGGDSRLSANSDLEGQHLTNNSSSVNRFTGVITGEGISIYRPPDYPSQLFTKDDMSVNGEYDDHRSRSTSQASSAQNNNSENLAFYSINPMTASYKLDSSSLVQDSMRSLDNENIATILAEVTLASVDKRRRETRETDMNTTTTVESPEGESSSGTLGFHSTGVHSNSLSPRGTNVDLQSTPHSNSDSLNLDNSFNNCNRSNGGSNDGQVPPNLFYRISSMGMVDEDEDIFGNSTSVNAVED